MVVSHEDRTIARYLCTRNKQKEASWPMLNDLGETLGIPFPAGEDLSSACNTWLPTVDFALLEQETFEALDKMARGCAALRREVNSWKNKEASLTFDQYESWFLDRVAEYRLYTHTRNLQKLQELKGTLQSNQLAKIIREQYGPKEKQLSKTARSPKTAKTAKTAPKRRWSLF